MVANNFVSWFAHYGYRHADPFIKPLPMPSVGIFDSADTTICFNSAWSPYLLGALSRLEYPELYIIDGVRDGNWAVNEIFKFTDAVAGVEDNPCLSVTTETSCTYYPSFYAGIEYIPHNPFDNLSEFDPQYPVAPFFRFGRIDTIFANWIDDFFLGVAEWATGYRENDIFVSYLSLPTATNPFDGLDYPTIKLTVQGTGTVKLKLLNVPVGGRALISLDPPDIVDLFNALWSPNDRIIELNRDILSIPPETDLDSIEEISLDTDGTHEIYITFLPVLNDEIPLLQMGGGFRGYELCGNLTVINPITGEPIDFSEPDNLDIYQEGFIMGTYEDFLSALDAHERRRSSRYLLGSDANNIKNGVEIQQSSGVDGGGVTIKNSGSGTPAPSVDATADEILHGAAMGVGRGFRDLVGDIVLRKITQQRTAQNVADLMRNFYFLRGLVDSVDVLASVLGTPLDNATDVVNPVVNPESIADIIYCNGANKQSLYRYALAVEDANGTDAVHIADFYRALIAEIEQEQIDSWFNAGQSVPSTGFLSAPCYVTPVQEFVYTAQNMKDSDEILGTIFSDKAPNNRWRFEVTGLISSVSGNVQFDGFYRRGGASTPYVATNPTFDSSLSGSFSLSFSTPVDIGGTLISEVDAGNNRAFFDSWDIASSSALNATKGLADLTGQLNIKIIDLGAL